MPSPKVFVSSTCYDLSMAREQLRSFLLRLGYDPILSEYSDVLYDPRAHTHSSCIQEVPNADMVVLLIGPRFGGKVIPEALNNVDMENLISSSFDVTVLEEPEKLSITQLEVLKAIDSGVPVFAFVEGKVMHDHFVYQKNKELVNKIKFPSLDKPESAKYIFEFINFLTHRNRGNSVIPFSKVEDIENHLKKQWGSLFQKLLREQREQSVESRKIFTITEQIEDLKTAMISTIGNAQNRDVARGVIKYRRLADFLAGLNLPDFSVVTNDNCPFEYLLELAEIVEIVDLPNRNTYGRTALVKSDRTYYELRFRQDFINRISIDWQSYVSLTPDVRQVIFDAISDMGNMGPGILRYRDQNFDDEFQDYFEKENNVSVGLEAFMAEESAESES
ncbi:DUF4062 domain-containing protein [Photobacterium leiognathi]|uniref:DUF4062 domain-containing protein n=1 Tax=Photobacterium leiognathi TaxID=553611 RepID=UPI0029812A18|nr:DUF4062 domain-containing protein [Photobacterium leiognathi]